MSHTSCLLVDYRRYMAGRCYARGVIAQRMSVARDWLARHPNVAAVGYRDVERWLAERDVAAVSQRNLLVNLRALYRWLQREGLAGTDPTALVDRPRLARRLPRPAAERDVEAVERLDDVELHAAVTIMAGCGLRCVEVSRLDWGDVSFAERTVIVLGKGSRERLVDMPADVVRTLAAWRIASRGAGAVFCGPSGRRRSPAAVSMWIRRAFRAAGCPTTTAHQLRHRCATVALQLDGVDILDVRDMLGHATVATTELYCQVLPGRTARIAAGMHVPAA